MDLLESSEPAGWGMLVEILASSSCSSSLRISSSWVSLRSVSRFRSPCLWSSAARFVVGCSGCGAVLEALCFGSLTVEAFAVVVSRCEEGAGSSPCRDKANSVAP